MSDFLGARISLISKSDIRYSGVLHEINSEESTVSLENVISYGTEGRKGKPEEEIPPADQIYEYIVFRGSDVKDLRIEETPSTKPPQPPAVPNDPAILGARPRPGNNNNAPPPFQPGQPPQGGPGFMHMPPPQAGWGPNGPGGPGGPSLRNAPYPPGWFPPPGPGFNPNAPGPWNNYYQPPFAQGPPGPGNNGRSPQPQQQQQQQQQQQRIQPPQVAPAPIGAGADKGKGPTPPGPAELQSEPKSHSQTPGQQPTNNKPIPTGPRAGNDVKRAAPQPAGLANAVRSGLPDTSISPFPTGPKPATTTQPTNPTPAGFENKPPQPAVGAAKQPGDASNAAALRDATEAAKAAVAVAMAKLEGGSAAVQSGPVAPQGPQGQYTNGSSAMDNLTRKVNEMRVNAARTGTNNTRGRGRGGPGRSRVEVPDADFDFASSNAKFNKAELEKEAGAGQPEPAEAEAPIAETAEADGAEAEVAPAYNKKASFFDNISSEAKDRAEKGSQKAGGREWRGEEQRRNIETFGQGSVDGGYRGHRGRGRGRGRGGYGRGRGNFRRNNDQ